MRYIECYVWPDYVVQRIENESRPLWSSDDFIIADIPFDSKGNYDENYVKDLIDGKLNKDKQK